MRESRTYGSVRGALSNERPYRDRCARNDEESAYDFALTTRSARVMHLSSAPIEGVGNAGCPLHPRSRVQLV